MRNVGLLARLTLYYLGLSMLLLAGGWFYPDIAEFLPIGGVEALLSAPSSGPLGGIEIRSSQVGTLGESLMWLTIAIAGALVAALPVSWTYIEIRNRREYDQSLVQTIIILPMVVTGIIIIVHNSLALAFSLAGIAAGVRFRNSLKSPGDVLFILLAIGIGLAAGIGAVELAIVMSMAFNYCFLVLWINDYGARKGAHRYMRRDRPADDGEAQARHGRDAADANAPPPEDYSI